MQNQESFNLLELFIAIRKRWILILLVIAVSLSLAFILAISLPPSYEAIGYLRTPIVADRPVDTPIMIKAYMGTPEIIKKIADKVELDYREVKDNLKLELVQNIDREKTVMHVLKFSASARDPHKAAAIINEAMKIVEELTSSYYQAWLASYTNEVMRIRGATDQMRQLLSTFVQTDANTKAAPLKPMEQAPRDQYTALAQGLAVGNGMMALAESLRLEAEWVAYLEQKTNPPIRRVNAIPPPEPENSNKLLIIGITGLASLIVSIGLAVFLYAEDKKKQAHQSDNT